METSSFLKEDAPDLYTLRKRSKPALVKLPTLEGTSRNLTGDVKPFVTEQLPVLHTIDRDPRIKREVLLLKDIPGEENARKIELKKLRENIKIEQCCFKRSQLTFELVEKAGTEPIGNLLDEE